MARTLIANYQPGPTAAVPTALDPTNGMAINHQWPCPKNATALLYVKNTAVAPKNITIKASDLAVQNGSTQYDKAHAVPASSEMYIRIDTVSYQRADNSYFVDVEAGMTGTVLAVWAK